MLENLRNELVALHQELPKNHLVVWTGGNISIRDPESGLVLIKPSGISYEALTAEAMILLDMEGKIIEGNLKPSSDTASHLFIYQHRPDINGIVHTHSAYATAFAALNRSIPVYLTAQADVFGGPIPCGGLVMIGGEDIGKEVVDKIADSKAILLRNHGVFTIGKSGKDAIKSAVMVEEIARTAWLALQLGQPLEIPPEIVQRLHHRYTHDYGQ